MYTISANISRYGTDGCLHTNTSFPIFVSTLKKLAYNFSEVDFEGVNNVCLLEDKDKTKIFQAGGYTPERGLFVDMY